MAGVTRLVLDTNVWLDWLVFDEPAIAPLREAHDARRIEIVMDVACEAELVRVLAYDLGRHSIDAQAQAVCLARCRGMVRGVPAGWAEGLPQCRDPDDQKFLALAHAARADFLVTKDQALLELARRVAQFRIVSPADCANLWPISSAL
jgi:putative PIN family toxin of toxin-antitoxin system